MAHNTSAAPMFVLMRKDTPFEWGPQQNAAFHELKQVLCKDPVLAAPNTEMSFILDTDASNTGLGAEQVVAYHSRTLDSRRGTIVSRARYCWQ